MQGSKDREFVNMVYSKHPLRDVRFHHLPGDSNLGERYVIESIVDAPGDVSFRLFATHLDVFDETENTRAIQVRKIIELAKQRRSEGDGLPHVLAGDLNALRRKDYSDVRWACIVRHDQKRGVRTQSLCALCSRCR